MRPVKQQVSVIEFPFDQVLGSVVAVRILRVMSQKDQEPLGMTRLAEAAKVTTMAARNSLVELERMGIVKRVGSGRSLNYAPNVESPLFEALAVLFGSEHTYFESIVTRLKAAFESPDISAAWIAAFPKGLDEKLFVCALVNTKAASNVSEGLREHFADISRSFNLSIRLELFTETPKIERLEDVYLLTGSLGPVQAF
jgi:DNA-binding Lrp family transcriptional regulator